jgi:hypothetical protein
MKLYTYLTGPDDENFCRRVCAKLNQGWQLYGDPALTYNGREIIAGQALTKEVPGEYHDEIKLKEM